jgi:hypothetical protein
MNKLMYRVARHAGGWVHQVNGTFSETFRTREEAREAARRAAEARESSAKSAAFDHGRNRTGGPTDGGSVCRDDDSALAPKYGK